MHDKMTEQHVAQLARIEAKQDEILKRLNETRVPHMTVRAFAEAAGVSQGYIFKLLRTGRLSKERGRIPARFLNNFTGPAQSE